MIKYLTVINYVGKSIKIDLFNPYETGLAIRFISGISSAKATINTNEIVNFDGSNFAFSKLTERNIVIDFIFVSTGGSSIEHIRHKLYEFFPVKRQIKLIFETETKVVEITGYVESNEGNIFTNKAGASISILCPNPAFYSYGENSKSITVFSGVAPLFEFPFHNEKNTESIIFSDIKNKNKEIVYYTGDIEVGIVILLHAIGDVRNIKIYNLTTDEYFGIDTNLLQKYINERIQDGDDILISMLEGEKKVTLIKGSTGERKNILNAIDKKSKWFKLRRGENILTYTSEYGASNLLFKVENSIAYEGL